MCYFVAKRVLLILVCVLLSACGKPQVDAINATGDERSPDEHADISPDQCPLEGIVSTENIESIEFVWHEGFAPEHKGVVVAVSVDDFKSIASLMHDVTPIEDDRARDTYGRFRISYENGDQVFVGLWWAGGHDKSALIRVDRVFYRIGIKQREWNAALERLARDRFPKASK